MVLQHAEIQARQRDAARHDDAVVGARGGEGVLERGLGCDVARGQDEEVRVRGEVGRQLGGGRVHVEGGDEGAGGEEGGDGGGAEEPGGAGYEDVGVFEAEGEGEGGVWGWGWG